MGDGFFQSSLCGGSAKKFWAVQPFHYQGSVSQMLPVCAPKHMLQFLLHSRLLLTYSKDCIMLIWTDFSDKVIEMWVGVALKGQFCQFPASFTPSVSEAQYMQINIGKEPSIWPAPWALQGEHCWWEVCSLADFQETKTLFCSFLFRLIHSMLPTSWTKENTSHLFTDIFPSDVNSMDSKVMWIWRLQWMTSASS